MKCVGFGSVQALWLGRLWYKERWQQAVDGKKHGFHIFRPQPRTSNNALRNHTTLSLRMPSLLKKLRPRSLSVLFQVRKMWLLIVTFFFPSVVVFYSSVCVYMYQSVNNRCSLLWRLWMSLLSLVVLLPLWETLKGSACVCLCALMCKYRKTVKKVVQKFHVPEFECSPQHLHKHVALVGESLE